MPSISQESGHCCKKGSLPGDPVRALQHHHKKWTQGHPALYPGPAGCPVCGGRVLWQASKRCSRSTSGVCPTMVLHTSSISVFLVSADCVASWQSGQSNVDAWLQVVLRKLFEKLGATYIKLGQFIASSPTLFPEECAFAHTADLLALRCPGRALPAVHLTFPFPAARSKSISFDREQAHCADQ